jgi:hypothetical protein
MIPVLSYSPGQTATIFLEVTDGYSNVRVDSLTMPYIARIFYPDLSLADGYPQNMTRLDIGLYCFKIALPTGASAIGSYLVDVIYRSPFTAGGNTGDDVSYAAYQIIVNSPFGNYGITVGT